MARRSVTIVASDGKREGISWYDGATEAAVLRCALVALGLPPVGTARLVWKSGDIVDFGKPITDGVTLHLDIAHDGGAGGGGFYSAGSGPGDVSSGYGGDDAGFGAGGGGTVAHRRVGGSSTAPAGGGSDAAAAGPRGGSIADTDRRRRRLPRPDPSESSLAKRRALLTIRRFFGVRSGSGGGGGGGLLRSFLEKTVSGSSDSEGEQERRPLLGISRSSSSTSLLSPSSSAGGASLGGGGGGGGGGRGERGADEVDGDGFNPDHQRNAILKLKRINAHLANERTLLAWVRCVGKMFTAGVLSLSLAGATGDRTFALCFAAMGMVYFAMGPYVVFVGASRFHQAAEVMQGSVHEAFSYFSGGHLRGLSFLMMALAAMTVGLMAIQLLASLELAA
eukprot:g12800.t1